MRARRSRFLRLARALAEPASMRVDPAWSTEAELAPTIELAKFHRVAGQLAGAFRHADLAVPGPLADLAQHSMLRHLRMLQALRRAGDALDAAGLAWLVVKGPALTGHWYRDGAARDYHDLDLLVGPTELAQAVEALGDAGFAERNRNWHGFRTVGMGELPLEDGRVTIDLHWSLVNFERERRTLRFDTDELLERRVTVALGSVSAPTLSDEDTFAHLVLHTGLAGARLLVHLTDIHVVGSRVAWEPTVRRLMELRLDRMAAVVVDRTERVLGPLGRGGRATSLGNGPWRRLSADVDHLWGWAAPGAFNPLPSFLVAATRPTVAESAGRTAALVGASVRRRLGLPTLASTGGVLDWDVDGGGRIERDRFLSEVEQGVFGR